MQLASDVLRAKIRTILSSFLRSLALVICTRLYVLSFAGYAHSTGSAHFRTRAPMQLAGTLGFVLGKKNGKFLGLSEAEMRALRLVIWGC